MCHLPPQRLYGHLGLCEDLHAVHSGYEYARVQHRGVLSLPLGCVVGELQQHVHLLLELQSRTALQSEPVAVLVVESAGVFPYIKSFARSTHKTEVSRGAGEAVVWRSLASLLVEGTQRAVTKEEGHRERKLVQAVT